MTLETILAELERVQEIVDDQRPAAVTAFASCRALIRKTWSQNTQVADTQPMPGWGTLCVDCEHVLPDDKKYVANSPSIACLKMQWDRGTPICGLMRFANGAETCPAFEMTEGTR